MPGLINALAGGDLDILPVHGYLAPVLDWIRRDWSTGPDRTGPVLGLAKLAQVERGRSPAEKCNPE